VSTINEMSKSIFTLQTLKLMRTEPAICHNFVENWGPKHLLCIVKVRIVDNIQSEKGHQTSNPPKLSKTIPTPAQFNLRPIQIIRAVWQGHLVMNFFDV